MLLGILSDTHDHLDAMRAGMKLLKDSGAEFYIHCGDVGGEAILDCLAGEKSLFVWGNCDLERVRLEKYARQLNIDCRGDWGEITLDGKRIVVTHGDDQNLVRKALAIGHLDYFLHGHTHIPLDHRIGKLRIINPGALYRAAVKTVALLDLKTDELRRLSLPDS